MQAAYALLMELCRLRVVCQVTFGGQGNIQSTERALDEIGRALQDIIIALNDFARVFEAIGKIRGQSQLTKHSSSNFERKLTTFPRK